MDLPLPVVASRGSRFGSSVFQGSIDCRKQPLALLFDVYRIAIEIGSVTEIGKQARWIFMKMEK